MVMEMPVVVAPGELHVAHFYNDQSGKSVELPVVGWDGANEALIVDAVTGQIFRAREAPDFDGVQPQPRCTAALPGQGWQATFVYPVDGHDVRVTAPVVGWLINERGVVTPISVAPDGETVRPVDVEDFKLTHPQAKPVTP